MHAIVGGCGRVGAQVAERLSVQGTDVVVVDARDSAFDRLGPGFGGDTLVGDFTDTVTLTRAGIKHAQIVVAVTSNDNVNLMAVQVATALFDVPRTVARLFNPAREDSYRRMGVHYVSGTRLVSQAILNEVRVAAFPQHVTFGESDIEIVEMAVTRAGHGLSIAELEREGDVRVAAIRRGGRVRLPKPSDLVLSADIVVAAVSEKAHRRLRETMGDPSAGDGQQPARVR